MCFSKPKAPAIQPLPPERQRAKQPERGAQAAIARRSTTAGAAGSGRQRSTVVNPTGIVRRSAVALLGGSTQKLGTNKVSE